MMAHYDTAAHDATVIATFLVWLDLRRDHVMPG